MHPAALPIDQLLRDVEFRTTRGPGPGGQHRNKSDTMVRLTHRPTGIQAQAGERRSLDLNKGEAIFRLRLKLALEIRSTAAATMNPVSDVDLLALVEPSELWRSRVKRGATPNAGRLVVSASHDDFPALLAEALDALARLDDDVAKAARALHVSSSQLVKFLGAEPAALAALNERRRARGLAALR
jgi:hypothetical protein